MNKCEVDGGNMGKKGLVTGGCLIFMLLFSCSAFAETLVIAGTGDSQAVLRKLALLFMAQNPGVTVEVPDSIGSGGGVKAIKQHKVGLARTARPLKDKEKSADLTEILFAESPVVFVTGPDVAINDVTSREVLDIYSGKIKNWKELGGPDHKIYPVDREKGDSSRKILKKFLPGFEAIKSVGKVLYSTPEAAEAIGGNSFTFGFVPLSIALEYKLHVLSLNGVAATAENGRSRRYRLLTPFYLIKSKHSGRPAGRFVDFIFTPGAGELMADGGVFPVRSR